ncbi:MAG: hypothetical protein WCR52_20010 [Bacteroidota bacterium]
MRKIFFLLASLCFSLTSSAQISAFWERVPGPYGGKDIVLTKTHSDTLYAQPPQSVPNSYETEITRLYRSTDNGQNWERLLLTLNGDTLHGYVGIAPNGTFNMVFGDLSSGISNLYRSFDSGLNWTVIHVNKSFFKVEETSSGALLGLENNQEEIWRSQDGGQTWSIAHNALPYLKTPRTNIKSLQNGDLILSGFLNYEIFRSSDDGSSWQMLEIDSVKSFPSGSLYASSSGALIAHGLKHLYRSTDQGQNWQKIDGTDYFGTLGLVQLNDGTLITTDATYKFVRSNDDGLSWHSFSANHDFIQILPIRLSNGTIFSICNALYQSVDGGVNWQFSANSMDLTTPRQLEFISEDSMFAMTDNGLWRTYNGGQNWTKLNDVNSKYIFFNQYYGSPLIRQFALGTQGHLVSCTENALLWSNDLGNTWINRTPSGGLSSPAVALLKQDSLLFVNGDEFPQSVLRSTDQGQTWQNTNLNYASFQRMELLPSGRILALAQLASIEQSLWQSDDLGLNWTKVSGLPIALKVVSNLNVDAYGTIWINGRSDFPDLVSINCHSTDNGESWQQGPYNATQPYGGFLSINAIGHLFIDARFRSVDNGLSWPALPNSDYIYSPIVDPISPGQYLYATKSYIDLYRTRKPTTEGAYLDGHVRRDADDDCSTADAQAPLPNWIVQADGTNDSWAVADTNGYYRMFVDTGAYSVQVKTFNDLWWDVCDSVQSVTLNTNLETKTSDFEVVSTAPCALMTVNVNIPVLRRCFNNTVFVSYCNQGAETADSAHIDITLDPFTDFVSAELPAENLGNNLYRFQLGDVASNDCGVFKFVVNVQCNTTVLGQTHCFSAHAFPDTLCTAVPNWSGAQIEARANCQDTLIQFKLKNVGTAVSQQLDYIIIIDDVVLMQGAKTYNPGEELILTQPTNGQTWRIESQQEPGQPFATDNHIALAFKEGCSGYNSLGYINKFPVDEFTPAWDRECVENRGSYDPNDKQGFPTGVGDTKQIGPNQELKYLIRFQNTGSDTAFTVVVRDTLSPWLNPATIRSVSGSHPFTWNLSGAGILTFTFNHIMLPDSNTNKAGSQGFISFTISQQKEVPLGAEIFNQAAIFFDFNFPVITNRTLHTVGAPLLSGTQTVVKPMEKPALLLAPSPASEFTVLRRSDGKSFQNARLVLMDARGQQQSDQRINGEAYRLERRALAAGAYFFRVEGEDGRVMGWGSVIWQ